MTGLRFLFRVTLRRLDLAADIYHIREPQKIPLVISTDEAKRLLAVAKTLRLRVLLSLAYGCGLRAGEVVRLRAGDIDSAQTIIRIVQAKGRKDRHVMLPPDLLALLRQWWKVRPTRYDRGVPPSERWLFPGRRLNRAPIPAQKKTGALPAPPAEPSVPVLRLCARASVVSFVSVAAAGSLPKAGSPHYTMGTVPSGSTSTNLVMPGSATRSATVSPTLRSRVERVPRTTKSSGASV